MNNIKQHATIVTDTFISVKFISKDNNTFELEHSLPPSHVAIFRNE